MRNKQRKTNRNHTRRFLFTACQLSLFLFLSLSACVLHWIIFYRERDSIITVSVCTHIRCSAIYRRGQIQRNIMFGNGFEWEPHFHKLSFTIYTDMSKVCGVLFRVSVCVCARVFTYLHQQKHCWQQNLATRNQQRGVFLSSAFKVVHDCLSIIVCLFRIRVCVQLERHCHQIIHYAAKSIRTNTCATHTAPGHPHPYIHIQYTHTHTSFLLTSAIAFWNAGL